MLKPDGSVYAKATLGPNGELIYNPPVGSPNTVFTCVACGVTGKNMAAVGRLTCPNMVNLATIVTDSKGNGVSMNPIPPVAPVIAGQIWYDNNKNGKSGDPIDVPITEKLLLKKPDGSIYATVTPDANGNFVYKPPVGSPNLRLTVVKASAPNVSLKTLITDSAGNGRVDLPIPPILPMITGQIWYDNNNDKQPGSTYDSPLANQQVVLKRPDGSIFATVVTDKNGNINYAPPIGEPNLLLTAFLPNSNKPLATFSTDPKGSGNVMAPIPPAKPVITASVWYDNNNDKLPSGPNDKPLANQPVKLLLPNGSVYATATLDPNGQLVYNPTTPVPNTKLTLMDATTNKPLGTIVTDPLGNGAVAVPIPPSPPVIAGKIWNGEIWACIWLFGVCFGC